ncbi:MAG: hypothetical protein K6A32_05065 [Bacteroidales bacterium]|nr:hypothetical protein [Bacteroidales bacterium]
MKRFIVISLLAFMALPMFACIWVDTHNWYLFRVCDGETFSERVNKITRDNWKAYLGLPADKYFWFQADEVMEAANAKNDVLMASYVKHLEVYVDVCNDISGDQWDYPTKEELDERNRTITNIRLYASSKLKTRLRSQHALLFMRCNMLLGRHEENIKFWEETASQFIESVYKEMMKNIYAGALYHTGHYAESGTIFAEQSDWNSLMTQYYQLRSCEAITREYNRDPNAAVLPFLLQDFVNNAQEALDANHDEGGGKLFIRDIKETEAKEMIALCGRAVANNETKNPALWQTAKAWLEYLYGDKQKAATDIAAALKMDGADQLNDVPRSINFYIQCATQPLNKEYDDFVAQELEWMGGFVDENGDKKFYRDIDRTIDQVLKPRYMAAGRQIQCLALMSAYDYSGFSFALDSLGVENAIKYVAYVDTPSDTNLDRLIKSQVTVEKDAMNDYIGTKYMHEGKWEEAAKWVEKVPVSFYAETSYEPYAVLRKWTVEPWIKRQWLSDAQVWGDQKPTLTFNPKLAIAKEMMAKEAGLNVLKGNLRLQRCYDLAVRYAQLDVTGDCWFLANESKTRALDWIYEDHFELEYLGKKAVSLLKEAAKSKDFHLRERALFALAYCYLNSDKWHSHEWDEASSSYRWISNPASQQYAAFAALVDFERQNEGQISTFVSNCDEYRQFIKQYK